VGGTGRGRAPAFTIIELLFAIGIIFLIMAMILGGLRFATRAGKSTADSTTVQSLKTAVEHFKQEFGFWPAMVKDQPTPAAQPAPLVGTPPRPNVYAIGTPADLTFLRQTPAVPTDADPRFSVYSLGFYVIGVLDKDVDGQDGPGFTTPTPDGAFSKKGRTFDPFFDTSRNSQAIFDTGSPGDPPGKIELRDASNVAFRYYRWMPDQGNRDPSDPLNDYLNVPRMIGDPTERQDVRSAEWAIVAAGRDGLFGDEHLLGTNHPQYVKPEDVASRLGIADFTMPGFDAEVVRRASKDNIVAIGGSRR
jgi:type II secretory pathway pseudopilin PulG